MQLIQSIPAHTVTSPFVACYKLDYESDSAPPLVAILVLGAMGLLSSVRNLARVIRELMTTTAEEPAPAVRRGLATD